MKFPRIDKVGADPEFGVVELDDDLDLLNQSAARALNVPGAGPSFIGVDGHNATGELRPPPCRNINNLVLHTGIGLRYTHSYLQKYAVGAQLWARPTVQNEYMGGHIHVSFTYDDADFYKMVYEHGQMLRSGEFIPYPNLMQRNMGGVFQRRCLDLESTWPTPTNFASTLNWLVEPFEYWIQPWNSRRKRADHYGNPLDVRITHHDPRNAAGKIGYFQYEYRFPSTWLYDPMLTYCYLALAKLCFLNWGQIAGHWDKPNALAKLQYGYRAAEGRAVFEQLFFDRFQSTSNWTRSADLSFLEPNLETLRQTRGTFWKPNLGININKWGMLANFEPNWEQPITEDLEDDPPPKTPGPTPNPAGEVTWDAGQIRFTPGRRTQIR